MPYEIAKVGKKVVVRRSTGDKKIIGRHPNRPSAVRQLRALYAKERGERLDK